VKTIAIPLLLVVGVTHFGYDWIAKLYEQQDAAARAWFYMLRGVEGAALFGVIATLARSAAVFAVCLLGMFEESLTTACRASKPIGESLGYAPFAGLCGREWYFAGLIALGLVALAIVYDLGRGRGSKRP
jgi:hypothetical protein